jgi:porphobilinogen synthase
MQPVRLRRLRRSQPIRDLVSQTRLSPDDLILPYFVVEGKRAKRPIESMPGVYRLSIDALLKDISQAPGIKSVLLFGVTSEKDRLGSLAYKKDGVIQKAIGALKKEFKDLIVITDVCLCGYTQHGHCGIVKSQKRRTTAKAQNYLIDNDETLKILAKIALSHAYSGADFVAPSAMMDAQVGTIRESLNKRGFKDVGIIAYSAKYASGFYGPFREALDSSPQFGDRKTYQMDYRNSNEALREIAQDISEGADIVMVKPALAYLDIIQRTKQNFHTPIAAYNVSGEYSMVKAYARGNKEIERKLVLEIITAIKRAGADLIITYWAKELVRWLKQIP